MLELIHAGRGRKKFHINDSRVICFAGVEVRSLHTRKKYPGYFIENGDFNLINRDVVYVDDVCGNCFRTARSKGVVRL